MKRIVILCDGTWNRSEAPNPTNVVRLARAVAPLAPDGIVQLPIYVAGVGAGRGVTRTARWSDRVLGGVFGWGLMDNVVEAYRHLAFLHEPGDEIFLFGFSRGAFTARSLAGLIRSTGLIDRDRLHLLPEAIARYRKQRDPRTHPSSHQSHEFRIRVSPRVVTGPAEEDYRLIEGIPEAPRIRIAYMGVWDTVGTLGVPRHLAIAPLLTGGRHGFHDTDLSSLVTQARHAIGLDERRPAFEPTRWTNLAQRNGGATGDAAPYQERFFAGDHGSVGGGGDIHDLSSIALDWIAEGAQKAGLALVPDEMARIRAAQNPLGPVHNFRVPRRGLAERLMRMGARDREGPGTASELHASVLGRLRGTSRPGGTRYRPGSLARIETDLAALLAGEGGEDPRRGRA